MRYVCEAMTPRHADVAYVLEAIAGVRAVYVVDASATHDFAIAVEHGGVTLAAVHYALLRVLSYEDVQRVLVFHTDAPLFISKAWPLVLNEMDRAAARARVPAPAPRPPIASLSSPRAIERRPLGVLVVSEDRTITPIVYEAFDSSAYCVPVTDHVAAAELASSTDFDVILCDGSRAFGLKGLLARLTLERADRVIVIVEPHDAVAARRRLQGDERIVVKPVTASALRERVLHRPALTMHVASFAIAAAPDPPRPERVLAITHDPKVETAVRAAFDDVPGSNHGFTAESTTRRCAAPADGEPFTAVLVDVPEDVAEALRRVLPIDSRHLSRTDPEAAAELLLSSPFHVAIVSAKTALAANGILSRVAREDRAGSERIVVVAPARDVPYVKHSLASDGHSKQRVIALPIDDVTLRSVLHREHPELTTRVAIAESDPFPAPSASTHVRILIVDDDITTQMLHRAAPLADVTLATTARAAFERIVITSVNVLVVSASMRSDGGEPLYRVLWRLVPELKARTVLITSSDLVARQKGVSDTHARRIVSRPLTAQVVGKIVEMYRDS